MTMQYNHPFFLAALVLHYISFLFYHNVIQITLFISYRWLIEKCNMTLIDATLKKVRSLHVIMIMIMIMIIAQDYKNLFRPTSARC